MDEKFVNRNTIRTAGNGNETLPVPIERLLLVDDHAPTREALNNVLRAWCFATFTAANVRQAQNAVLTEKPFTVIISDYDLPDGSGLEFLDWLRQEMQIYVPFLLISAGMTHAPSAADGYEFLAKPFSAEELRSRLDQLVRLTLQTAAPSSLTVAQEAMASVYARSKPRQDG
jgi:DNA-binding response OmpR family regulator